MQEMIPKKMWCGRVCPWDLYSSLTLEVLWIVFCLWPSLPFVPASPEAFFPLRATASFWQCGYCSRTAHRVFPCHLLSLRRQRHGLVQTVWVGPHKPPRHHRDSYGMWQIWLPVQSSTDIMWGTSHIIPRTQTAQLCLQRGTVPGSQPLACRNGQARLDLTAGWSWAPEYLPKE